MKRTGIGLVIVQVAFGAVGNVAVRGVTSTQAILTYTAPDAGVCSVEVSESATYRPLVHDVESGVVCGGESGFSRGERVERTAESVSYRQAAGGEGIERALVFPGVADDYSPLLPDHVWEQHGDGDLPDIEHTAGCAGGVETGVTGLSCASGYTVAVPGLSQRILYYQVKYRDASNRTLATGQVEAVAVP